MLTQYTPDQRLCVVASLREYLKRTKTLRNNQLLISYPKPHKGVTTDTISRWLKLVLKLAGIDTAKFNGYSTRAASILQPRKGLKYPSPQSWKVLGNQMQQLLILFITNRWTIQTLFWRTAFVIVN